MLNNMLNKRFGKHEAGVADFLVADQLASATSTFENPGVDYQKVQIRHWVLFLQKIILFCDGQVFFIDRGLLMGATITTLLLLQIPFVYHSIFSGA